MKILLLNLLMSVATQATDPIAEDYSWVLQELNAESSQMVIAGTIENKVKVFDATGNLVKEILKSDFDENNMEDSEVKLISNSVFMFNYLGDSYFLLEE